MAGRLTGTLLAQSGQLWKFVIAAVALLVGSFAPLYPPLGVSWTLGTVIAVVGYAFGMLFVQCRHCDSRWLWQAALGKCGYGPLFKAAPCPTCGHQYGGPKHVA